jgi:hypothetical protein
MPFSAVSQFISQIDTAEGSGCALRYVAAQFLKDFVPQVEEKCLRGKAPMLATSGVFSGECQIGLQGLRHTLPRASNDTASM